MPLLVLFILVPIIEIALFIQVGGLIGLWPTLAIVVLTAVLGTWMLRQQGLSELAKLRGSLENFNDPTESLAHGAMIIFAGALLLTPGFFTDAVGFSLLVPGIRRAVMSYVSSKVQVATFNNGAPRQHPSQGDIIDGEFHEVAPERGSVTGTTKSDH